MLIYGNKIHRFKTKFKNIKTVERIFWRGRKKTTGNGMIKIFLNISLRPEGVLHHLCKSYIACIEKSKG